MLLIKHQYYDLLKTIGLEGNELEIIPLMKKLVLLLVCLTLTMYISL